MGVPYAEVIGDPVAHSKSPMIHNFWLERLGIGAVYRRARVSVDELPNHLERRRADPDWRGCSITMPLKEQAFGLVDEVDGLAKRVGALNVIRHAEGRLIGYNTDVAGILDVLPPDCFVSGALPEVCIIGAGGAARAVLAACEELGVSLVFFNVRDQPTAWRLLKASPFGGTVGGIDNQHNLMTPHLIVNATPLGMRGHAPMPEGVLRVVEKAGSHFPTVFDMVYDPAETDLLGAARRGGRPTVDGLALLLAQARHAFRLFFGRETPRDREGELRELLTQ